MKLINTTVESLADLVSHQLNQLYPDDEVNISETKKIINKNIKESLLRLQKCINSVKTWPRNEFNYLHSSQYCTFLYYLSNTIWKNTGNVIVPTKLFLLNKSLNAIDLFYEINMPDIFFIGHSVGVVLCKAKYDDYLVLYQNSTVGKNYGIAPELGKGVYMSPNSAIIGASKVGDNTFLSQGASIIGQSIPPDSTVYSSAANRVVVQPRIYDFLSDIFRL